MPALTQQQGAVHGYIEAVSRDWPPSLGTWQTDYFATVMGISVLRGNNSKALTIMNWMANFTIGRVSNAANGMDPKKAAPYQMILANSGGTRFTSWAQVGAANSVSIPANENYPAIYLAALASVYNATGNAQALQGYNLFSSYNPLGGSVAYADQEYSGSQAKFRIIPTSGTVNLCRRISNALVELNERHLMYRNGLYGLGYFRFCNCFSSQYNDVFSNVLWHRWYLSSCKRNGDS